MVVLFHRKLVYLSGWKRELNIQGASLNLKKRNFVTILVTIALKNGAICHYSLLKMARLRESRHNGDRNHAKSRHIRRNEKG
ncbi:MAG: hypothetical protein CMD81_05730 [Gammaproteobacteria bacterium]|nr:hypothetical protein [Gammaproteobacteria bacterium]